VGMIEKPNKHLPSKTTEQEDITFAGQRRINLIWEIVQGFIAIIITASIIYNTIKGIDLGVLENAFFLIVSMYFVRTNHTKIGGIKRLSSEKYDGR
jgi:hypothetical protein